MELLICYYEFIIARIYFHWKSDLIQNFYATKIWSYTVSKWLVQCKVCYKSFNLANWTLLGIIIQGIIYIAPGF